MLIRKCSKHSNDENNSSNNNLSKIEDCDCRVTIYSVNSTKQDWLELIKSFIGNGICSSVERFKVTITNDEGIKVFNKGVIQGNIIMDVIDTFFKEPKDIKINISNLDYKSFKSYNQYGVTPCYVVSRVEKPKTWILSGI